MRIYVVVLCLFFSLSCQAQEPLITFTHADFGNELKVGQSFELWTQGTEEWQLKFEFPSGLQLANPGQNWRGVGETYENYDLDLAFDLQKSTVGVHTFTVAITLEGAQGILGLFNHNQYWVLPLNCQQASVQRGTENIPLLSGQWFLTQGGDSIFLDAKLLKTIAGKELSMMAITQAQPGQKGHMWWDVVRDLEAGEQTTVTLNLQRPFKGGSLILQAESPLAFLSNWILEPGGEQIRGYYQGKDLILDLPPLQGKKHTLTGTLQSLLPLARKQASITAFYAGERASQSLEISRTWFDFDHKQNIRFKSAGKLILPDGSKHEVQEGTILTVQERGLQPLLVINDLQNPIWLNTPLGEVEMASFGGGPVPDQYFVPMLFYNQGWKWRLVSQSGPWFVSIGSKNRLFQAQLGSVQIQGSDEEIMLAFAKSEVHRDGEWLWWEDSSKWQGVLQQDRWSYSLELPKNENTKPIWGLSCGQQDWFINLKTNDLILSHKTPYFGWGVRLSTKFLWLEDTNRNWYLEVKPQNLRLTYKVEAGVQYKLQLTPESWKLDAQGENWETYVGNQGIGFRLKHPKTDGAWRFLTLLSAEITPDVVLAEIENRIGYALDFGLTPYISTIINTSYSANLPRINSNFSYEFGLLFQPMSQVFSQLSWDKRAGCKVRLGVVVPFAGE